MSSRATIRLVGDSPLICHAWSEKARRQMLDKQMKKAKTAKESKDPFEDMVRVGMGKADIRFRGEFTPWATEIVVSYNASALSPEQIVNLFNLAGFGGWCWRVAS